MNRLELKQELEQLRIKEYQYSLAGELNLDSIVLFHNYAIWEVFYLDEKGRKDALGNFKSEEDACKYLYDFFCKQRKVEKEFGLNT